MVLMVVKEGDGTRSREEIGNLLKIYGDSLTSREKKKNGRMK
jgi:hypothetical protein